MTRTAPVASQRPVAEPRFAMRIRNIGFAQTKGTGPMPPVKSVLPCSSRGVGRVSIIDGFVPGLHTNVPITCWTGPLVPVALPPFNTSPSTKNDATPVSRSTLALPEVTVQARVPAEIPATGLSTPGAVITPTMLFQRTVESPLFWANDVEANNRTNNSAKSLFI